MSEYLANDLHQISDGLPEALVDLDQPAFVAVLAGELLVFLPDGLMQVLFPDFVDDLLYLVSIGQLEHDLAHLEPLLRLDELADVGFVALALFAS
jgi:hypothetical protein